MGSVYNLKTEKGTKNSVLLSSLDESISADKLFGRNQSIVSDILLNQFLYSLNMLFSKIAFMIFFKLAIIIAHGSKFYN